MKTFLLFLVLAISLSPQNLQSNSTFSYDILNKPDGVVAGPFTSFDFITCFDTLTSAKELAIEMDYSFVFNATYFDYESGIFSHAGLLVIDDSVYSALKENDAQLSYIWSIEKTKSHSEVEHMELWMQPETTSLIVQTGPRIITNSKIDTLGIMYSINGNHSRERTIVVILDKKIHYVLLVKDDVTLTECAKLILGYAKFKGHRIDAINLDGGSSTAYFSQIREQARFREDKKLPLFIGIK